MYSYELFEGLNLTLATGGIFLLLGTILLFIDYLFWDSKKVFPFITPYTWHLIILATVGSVILSLTYSEYFGFIPCSLCWLQRIAIYPQALIALIAFQQKDTLHFPLYGIGLSVFGFAVAAYQYIYQMLPQEVLDGGLPCLADGSNADCAVKVINEFGFVTFPFLSAVTFAFLMALYLHLRKQTNV